MEETGSDLQEQGQPRRARWKKFVAWFKRLKKAMDDEWK